LIKLADIVISRKKRAFEALKKYNVDGWLIISSGNDANAEYLVGTKVFGTIAVLLTRDKLISLVSSLEKSMIDENTVDEVLSYYGAREFIAKLMEMLSEISNGRLLVNMGAPLAAPYASRILYSHAKIIESLANLYGIELIPSSSFVRELRSIKTNEELTALELAVKATLNAVESVINKIKPGMSEREVAAEMYREIYLRGDPAFEVIVAFGKNSANPHHKTSDKKLRNGEIGYIDVGIKLYSICADITRAFFTNSVDREFYTIYKVVRDAQDASINIIRDGVAAKDPDQKAREVIEMNGYDPKEVFTHGLGHPLGVEVHDVGPALSFLVKKESTLKENMALTIEPAIYIKDKGGIRLEDDIVVKKDGVLRISKAPDEPPII